jgi:hypothetical protein
MKYANFELKNTAMLMAIDKSKIFWAIYRDVAVLRDQT